MCVNNIYVYLIIGIHKYSTLFSGKKSKYIMYDSNNKRL